MPETDVAKMVGEAFNTKSELCTALRHIGEKAVIISSEYHIMYRVPHLFAEFAIKSATPGALLASPLSAERIVTTLDPGLYDQEIHEGYKDGNIIARCVNEWQGVVDLLDHQSPDEEFQKSLFDKA